MYFHLPSQSPHWWIFRHLYSLSQAIQYSILNTCDLDLRILSFEVPRLTVEASALLWMYFMKSLFPTLLPHLEWKPSCQYREWKWNRVLQITQYEDPWWIPQLTLILTPNFHIPTLSMFFSGPSKWLAPHPTVASSAMLFFPPKFQPASRIFKKTYIFFYSVATFPNLFVTSIYS